MFRLTNNWLEYLDLSIKDKALGTIYKYLKKFIHKNMINMSHFKFSKIIKF